MSDLIGSLIRIHFQVTLLLKQGQHVKALLRLFPKNDRYLISPRSVDTFLRER